MAEWELDRQGDLKWCREINSREEKERVARCLAGRLSAGDVVGVGSGSTSFLTLLALAERSRRENLPFSVIVTSLEILRACSALRVSVLPLTQARPDWSFDGADEISRSGRMIKGRGGALFREKLVMAASLRQYIVVDSSKFVKVLGERFPVPIEVAPDAIEVVRDRLKAFDLAECDLRLATRKDGPVITESGCVILDVRFRTEVPSEGELECIPGVIATGVFDDWEYEIITPGASEPKG